MHLSVAQLKVVTDILVSAGGIFLASLVIPSFIGEFSTPAFVIGLMLASGAWFIALFINKQNSFA